MDLENKILGAYGTTIFEKMSRLAVEYNAINLGQGFPDEDGPEEIKKVASDWLLNGYNQYPSMMGIESLRKAVADHNFRFYDIKVQWDLETMVTSGATEAIAACCFAFINPGDEVVVIEPLYDCYVPLIERAGGVAVSIQLQPPYWTLTDEMLASAFSEKTKLIILNNPMNPSGKVFTREELSLIANYVNQYNCIAICDEVYEHLVYEPAQHIPLMTLSGMRDKAVRIGSAGKTFSLTGWKVGYITADKSLMGILKKAHQFLTFTTPPNLQAGIAHGLQLDNTYFEGFSKDLAEKRDFLKSGLEKLGFRVTPSDGTYFLNVDIRSAGVSKTDVEFCEEITKNAGLAAVPVSAFYIKNPPSNFVRFCFCKKKEILEEALKRLEKYLLNKS